MRYSITLHFRLSNRGLAIFVALVAALALTISVAPAAQLLAISVTTTDDELNRDGDCSLREAIRAANLDTPVDACVAGHGADTINLPAGTYTLSISGAGEDAAMTGDLDITDGLTIVGVGAGITVVDGNAIDRVFEIIYSANVHIANVTILNGRPRESDSGGGVFNNGGVLSLTGSVVSGNTTRVGGGIENTGVLVLHGSIVKGNSAFDRGGGIHSIGILSMTNSTVSDNFGGRGGGINATGVLSIINSTISGNSAERGGGMNNAGFLSMINSTISSNTAGRGGGIDNMGSMTITSSTVVTNTASQGGGIFNADGSASVGNTIVARNIATDAETADCGGTLTSLGYNLIQSLGACLIAGNTVGNLIGQDPMLGSLAANGGATPTHALLPDSPAIDTGVSGSTCALIDQRGLPRPQDGNGDGIAICDIGAYEFQATVSPCDPTITPTPVSFASPVSRFVYIPTLLA